jgi:hypothetical protein
MYEHVADRVVGQLGGTFHAAVGMEHAPRQPVAEAPASSLTLRRSRNGPVIV